MYLWIKGHCCHWWFSPGGRKMALRFLPEGTPAQKKWNGRNFACGTCPNSFPPIKIYYWCSHRVLARLRASNLITPLTCVWLTLFEIGTDTGERRREVVLSSHTVRTPIESSCILSHVGCVRPPDNKVRTRSHRIPAIQSGRTTRRKVDRGRAHNERSGAAAATFPYPLALANSDSIRHILSGFRCR